CARVVLGAAIALVVVDATKLGRHGGIERPQVQEVTRDTHAVLDEERGQDERHGGLHQDPLTDAAVGPRPDPDGAPGRRVPPGARLPTPLAPHALRAAPPAPRAAGCRKAPGP